MPDIECRVANLETRMSNIESRSAGTEQKVQGMSEVLTERRRQSDSMMDILIEIKGQVAGMRGFSGGVKWAIGAMAAAIGGLFVIILNKVFDNG